LNTIGHYGTTLYFAEKTLLQLYQSIKILHGETPHTAAVLVEEQFKGPGVFGTITDANNSPLSREETAPYYFN